MEVVDALTWHSGVTDVVTLRHLTSRRRIRTALGNGTVVRLSRGRFGLPDADLARREAGRLAAVVSHLSAAQLNGWELKTRPTQPMLTVPRGRKVEPWRRRGVTLHWRALDEDEVWNGRTTAARTVIDCAKDLPFDEALSVADSALRHGNVTGGRLLHLADLVATSGRTQCLRVAHEADGRAANPFESVLRAISLDLPDLRLKPQVTIDEEGWTGRPDLVDVERRLVVEADSFEFHGRRRALTRDCERYNALALRGRLVLRFSYEHVMFAPDYVRSCLEGALQWRPPRPTARPVRVREAG